MYYVLYDINKRARQYNVYVDGNAARVYYYCCCYELSWCCELTRYAEQTGHRLGVVYFTA